MEFIREWEGETLEDPRQRHGEQMAGRKSVQSASPGMKAQDGSSSRCLAGNGRQEGGNHFAIVHGRDPRHCAMATG
jgi:hypothetical protein